MRISLVLSVGVVLGAAALAWFGRESAQAADKEAVPELGHNARLNGKPVFPPDDPWNHDISQAAVDPNSDALIAAIGKDRRLHPDFGTTINGRPNGMPYVIVGKDQPKVPVTFEVAGESDPGPYPIPPDAAIEGGPPGGDGGGDRHVIVIDRDNWILYELFGSHRLNGGKAWKASSGAIFNLKTNTLRPPEWTSADAAGLPIFPGLVRYEEVVERKEINHAIRFTAPRTRRAYTPPARHWASRNEDPNLPPMGMRVRLKADYDISRFPANVQVILKALKKHGMILADNGSPWFITGSPDPRWNDDEMHKIKQVRGSDFEVVRMGMIFTPRHRQPR